MKRFSLAALTVWLALLGVSVVTIARSGLSTDLQAFLPATPTPAQQVLVDQLRDGLVSRLILVAIEGSEPRDLAGLSREVARRLADDPAFVRVDNGSQDTLQSSHALLVEHRYLLSPAIREGHFSEASLRRALQLQLQLLASSMGAVAGSFVASDPTGEFLSIIEQFESAQQPEMRHGVWFNATGTRALLVARTSSPGFDIDGQEAALNRIAAAFEASRAESAVGGVELITVGPGVFAVQIRDAIRADAIRVTAAAALAIAALLLFVMRSLRALTLVVVPVVSGALAGVAAVALWFGDVHGITIGFGATLIGESVDYAIHLLTGATRGQRPSVTLARIWPTLRLGVMTSIVGTAALLFSGFPGLAQLALFSIVGLIVALAVTRWIVPIFMPPDFSIHWTQSWESGLRRIVENLPRVRIPVLLLIVLCAGALLIKADALWRDDFESLSPVPQSAKSLDREIRAELGAPDVRHLIVIRGVDQEATLQIAESAARVLEVLVGEGVLAGFDSPARYLPSQAAQRARQEAIPDERQLRSNLSRAAAGLPFKADIFEAFVRQAQRAKAATPLSRDDLGSSALGDRVDMLLTQHRGAWHAVLPLHDVAKPDVLAAGLRAFDPQQLVLLDLKSETDALYRGYRVQILTFSLVGAIAIVLLLLATMRSVSRTAAVVMPVVAAVVASIAVLVTFDIRLNMFHIVAMLLVIGVGTNYTLFFDRALQQQAHSGRIYVALATCNLSTVLGFGLIALASTPVLAAIGMTVSLGAAFSLIFGAVFMNIGGRGSGTQSADKAGLGSGTMTARRRSTPASQSAPDEHG